MTESSLSNEWHGPPLASFHGTIPMSTTILRKKSHVVALLYIQVFQTGCILNFSAAYQRAEGVRSHAELKSLHDSPGGLPTFVALFPDGSRASSEHGVKLQMAAAKGTLDGVPQGPVLVGGPGAVTSSSDSAVEIRQPLWLWPLPPPEEFSVRVTWGRAEASDVGATIDGSLIHRAVADARGFWD